MTPDLTNVQNFLQLSHIRAAVRGETVLQPSVAARVMA
jgi:hypothetical protein